MKPLARSTGLVIRDLPDEVVVYDRECHQAHCLNRTAAFVFRQAGGRRTAAEIAALVRPDAGVGWVHAALDQLAAAGLLDTGSEAAASAPAAPAPSRREMLRHFGLGAAVLAPAVASLLVPTPAEAAATCIQASGCNDFNVGQPCYNSNPAAECLSFTCQEVPPGTCS
jgi:hypothetical protein